MRQSALSRLLRAGLLTGVIDGLFAIVMNVFIFNHVTVTRLFQGIASVLLGKEAFNGGAQTAILGAVMHFGVAFGWSAVLLVLLLQSAKLRDLVATPSGALSVACLYGPLIWIVMSLGLIPAMVHRPANVNTFWWIELVGHIPFVSIPMIWMLRSDGVAKLQPHLARS